jgi:ribonucleoside-diphosphate reductase alpha chain
MSLHNLKDVTYFDLNNEINIPVNGQIPLQKDQEALQAFLKENVEPNLKRFDSLKARFDYLIDNNYYEADFVKKYDLPSSKSYTPT